MSLIAIILSELITIIVGTVVTEEFSKKIIDCIALERMEEDV
jgi:hypothetical protein